MSAGAKGSESRPSVNQSAATPAAADTSSRPRPTWRVRAAIGGKGATGNATAVSLSTSTTIVESALTTPAAIQREPALAGSTRLTSAIGTAAGSPIKKAQKTRCAMPVLPGRPDDRAHQRRIERQHDAGGGGRGDECQRGGDASALEDRDPSEGQPCDDKEHARSHGE